MMTYPYRDCFHLAVGFVDIRSFAPTPRRGEAALIMKSLDGLPDVPGAGHGRGAVMQVRPRNLIIGVAIAVDDEFAGGAGQCGGPSPGPVGRWEGPVR